MMAGNPNWWKMNIPSQPCSSSPSFLSQSTVPPLCQYPHSVVFASSPISLPLASLDDYSNPELPQSWSQLLLNEFSGDEEKYKLDASFPTRNMVGNWEEQTILNNNSNNHLPFSAHLHSSLQYRQYILDCPQELFGDQAYNYLNKLQNTNTNAWSTAHNMAPASSPTSCMTTLSSTITTTTKSSNILDFSNSIDKKVDPGSRKNHQKPDHSSNEVRKEKLGDRITALHKVVSPFGKTDTASVLLEAIGYIRFLHGQIEVLSSSYIDSASGDLKNSESESGNDDMTLKDLRSRGLCLVPVSFTLQVEGNDNGGDYWAPAPFSGGF